VAQEGQLLMIVKPMHTDHPFTTPARGEVNVVLAPVAGPVAGGNLPMVLS
jgi:hypothetical protein